LRRAVEYRSMPDLGNIGVSMNTIGTTINYTNVGAINRVAQAGATGQAEQSGRTPPQGVAGTQRTGETDRVELSEHARFMEKLRSMPPVRADKVAQIRAEIEAGTYESDEKLTVAMNRLLEDLDTI
jgi:negative regulator of flagellin synthesis FlgM